MRTMSGCAGGPGPPDPGVARGAWPPVSVIVPARDAESTIAATLESILAQDYEGALEAIVADGSGSSATEALVRDRFPGVRLVANPEGTIPAGLNRALRAARHDIIARCDAHSTLPASYLTRAVATLRRTGAANVGGRVRPVGSTRFERAVALVTATPLGAGDARYRVGGPEGPVDTVFPGVFRRDALVAAGGWDETLLANEDYALSWRLRERGETVWFDPALAVDYRPRGSLAALARQYFRYGRWEAGDARAPSAVAARAAGGAAGAAGGARGLGGARRGGRRGGERSAGPGARARELARARRVRRRRAARLRGCAVALRGRDADRAKACRGAAAPRGGGDDPPRLGGGLRRGPARRRAKARRTFGVAAVSAGSVRRRGEGRGSRPAPSPAAVRHNDWRAVDVADREDFVPALPVSVIVPCFEAPQALALTLAGLEGQCWPRDLVEVVVVDDGSDPPLRPPACALDVRVVRQERRGFGLARARNAGVRAAAHDILVFLDGDVIPEAGLLAAHARWHHAVSDALTVGFCACVSVAGIDAAAVRTRKDTLAELFAGRGLDAPWLERHMARTGDLTSRHEDLFRAVTGGNFAVSRALFEEVGGFDESFDRYGGEDTELAYRAQVRGALLVPARDALGWHQGRWRDGREAKERSQDLQASKLAELIADPGFRTPVPGGRFAVPRHVVTVDAGETPEERIATCVDELLADAQGDLAVRIEVPADRRGDRTRLRRRYGAEPRVRVAPDCDALDELPASPLHVTVPARRFGPGLVRRLDRALGDAAGARAVLEDGSELSIVRAWALHRARRAGGRVEDYGEVRAIGSAALRCAKDRARAGTGQAVGDGARASAPRPAPVFRRRGVRAAFARVRSEARHVRGVRTGWRFLRWLAGAVRWRLREGRGWTAAPVEARAKARADAPLGAAIATLGPLSRAAFAASARVAHDPGAPHLDAVLADTGAHAAGAAAPVALVSAEPALAVPAFDPALDNPVGWVREVEARAAALGPPGLLPDGVSAHRRVRAGDRDALRHCHHLEDVAAFHAGAVERAGVLARLAACGVPVHLADGAPALETLLGAELHALMCADVASADAAAREALSIAMRRAALRGHTLRARARQICDAAGVDPPELARVSVLLATRRPARLARAVANVKRQRYPRIELVLALHGPGFEPAAVERALAGLGHPARVLRLGADRPLGAVLNAASAEASGALLAKMDDDDLYGPEHLWDLVLAHEYSGAALVGKLPATVYLARLDRTVRTRSVPGEVWSHSIGGGALLLGRAELACAGGWRDAPRHVDRGLVEDVARSGGAVYRTHDAGYLLVRHGEGHTWERPDAAFLAGAQAVHAGWRPDLAGIGDAPACPGGVGGGGWGEALQ